MRSENIETDTTEMDDFPSDYAEENLPSIVVYRNRKICSMCRPNVHVLSQNAHYIFSRRGGGIYSSSVIESQKRPANFGGTLVYNYPCHARRRG